MTLSPDSRTVERIEGPSYELNLQCPVPGCQQSGSSLERHHLWRRSLVGGDYWWVRTADGRVHGNCVAICKPHHRVLTDNLAHILYDQGRFWWTDVISEPELLNWQPPDEELLWRLQSENQPGVNPVHYWREDKMETRDDPDVCPTCLRKLPQPKSENPEEKKPRKTWSVCVPIAELEDGANVIDALLKEAHLELNRLGLPYGEGKTVKYYVLVSALSMFVLHAESLMGNA